MSTLLFRDVLSISLGLLGLAINLIRLAIGKAQGESFSKNMSECSFSVLVQWASGCY